MSVGGNSQGGARNRVLCR